MEPYVAFTVIAALVFAAGGGMQKHGIATRLGPVSAVAFARRPGRVVGALCRNPLWVLGSLLTLVGFGLETQALGLGDLSVVKPLSRLQTLFTLLIGVWLLSERLASREWLGLGVMLVGVLMLGSEPADALVYVPDTTLSFGLSAAIVLLVLLLVPLAESGRWRLSPDAALALPAGALFSVGDLLMKLGTEVVRLRTGAFDLPAGSSLPTLLKTAEFQLAFAATLLAFVLQQLAFSRGRVSVVIPVAGAAGTLLTALLGFGLLHEPLNVLRVGGIASVIAGTLLATLPGAPPAGLARAPSNVL